MRITCNEGDYGYQYFQTLKAEGRVIKAFLDDVEQHGCVVADEEAGYVIRNALTPEGLAQVDPKNPDRVLQETLHGRVRIEITPPL